MILNPLDINAELKNVQRTFSLTREDIVMALRKTLISTLTRQVFIIDDSNSELKIYRQNKDGQHTKVSLKSIRSNKKAFGKELEQLSIEKRCERIKQLFKKTSLTEGTILDKTHNGYFVVCKGERAFLTHKNCYESEKNKGMYENGVRLFFAIDKIYLDKIYLTRKSIKIFQNTILNIISRTFKMKLSRKGLVLYCDKPFLDQSQMQTIQSNIPVHVIFKKNKDC